REPSKTQRGRDYANPHASREFDAMAHSEAPPQIAISCPVIAAASGESRNATSAATSSGRMRRPIGGITGGTAARAGSASIAVSVAAGATTFTVMPRGASSLAQDRARPASAALVAPYWLRLG